ncbi:MAG: hypothetical protein EOP10_18670 [Proteobacteria bacterium]|nr:MAG: hypothetical protein EOP10_18670 [Pseudomonadota bacterium]
MNEFQPNDLIKIANLKMPFGKYKGRALIDLPEAYIIWFHKKGIPEGEIGRLIAQLYDIKANGLEYLFNPLRGVDVKPAATKGKKSVRDLRTFKDSHSPK